MKLSKAKNTIRAYKSDFNDFELFCAQSGFKSLPSEPKVVSLYLTHLSTKKVKMSTLKRRLVSIGVIHKIKGFYLDTKHPTIIENILPKDIFFALKAKFKKYKNESLISYVKKNNKFAVTFSNLLGWKISNDRNVLNKLTKIKKINKNAIILYKK